MDAEQSLPVVFSNLGISEVASSFRRTLATVLSSAFGLLGDRGLGHLWPSTTQQLKDALLEAAERLG
jgi:hypothetical protein